MKNLPAGLEHLGRGDLADYVGKRLKEDGVL